MKPLFTSRVRHSAGFTLIEIMVVVVIIGLLAAFIVPQVMGRVDEARITKARGDIEKLETALAMFRLDTSRYPVGQDGITSLVKKPEDPNVKNWRTGGYLGRPLIPKDPWGNEYRYAYPGTHGTEYDLYSLGPDGQEGGEDADKDNIGNWNQGG